MGKFLDNLILRKSEEALDDIKKSEELISQAQNKINSIKNNNQNLLILEELKILLEKYRLESEFIGVMLCMKFPFNDTSSNDKNVQEIKQKIISCIEELAQRLEHQK